MIILLCLSLSGCWNLYAGQRPDELGPAIWKSDNPDIWFEVYETDPELGYVEPKGQLVYKGVTHSFIVMFNNADGIVLQSKDATGVRLISGRCKFYPNKLIVTIRDTGNYIYGDEVEVITFIRFEKSK